MYKTLRRGFTGWMTVQMMKQMMKQAGAGGMPGAGMPSGFPAYPTDGAPPPNPFGMPPPSPYTPPPTPSPPPTPAYSAPTTPEPAAPASGAKDSSSSPKQRYGAPHNPARTLATLVVDVVIVSFHAWTSNLRFRAKLRNLPRRCSLLGPVTQLPLWFLTLHSLQSVEP